jgi:hypothetical protein
LKISVFRGGGDVCSFLSIFLFFLFLLSIPSYGQQGQIINVVASSEPVENASFTIKANVKSLSDITQAILFYRNDLSSDFQQVEMTLDETTMTLAGAIPASYVLSPYVEVYIRITMRDGTSETYPSENAVENPVRFAVAQSGSQEGILIISPEKNQRLSIDDLMIAASMLYAPDFVDRKKTQLFFDGVDVTADAVVSGDIIVYSPSKFPMEISGGIHSAKVVLHKADGSEYGSLEWSFFVISPFGQAPEEKFTYNGNGQIELRDESISGSSTWYNRGDLNFAGNGYGVGIGANLHLTSEEKSYRQPQDRYGLYANTSWLSLKLGDSYPTFSPLIMNGMRVRGVAGKISAGFFNLEAAYGQTVRKIDGQYLDTVKTPTTTNYIKLDSLSPGFIFDSLRYINVNYGTYSRNLLAIRPSFDFGSHAELGFTYLKSSDAAGSIGLGNDPNQNLVLGSDFSMNFDEHRINFLAEGAMSIVNQNIAAGNLTADSLDSISHSDAGTQINKVVPLTTIEKFITINQFLVPLDPTKLSSLAWDVNLSLNYFNTFAKIGYVYRGPDYNSFGQPYIRTDIRGLNVALRPRFYSNQILLSIYYESLFDNLQNNKFATTHYANTNVAASYFPIIKMPSLTLGFSSYSNVNSIPVLPDTLHQAIDNTTIRYYVESSYGFDYIVRQFVTIDFGISNRNDRVVLGTDLSDFNFAFLVNSDFGDLPLKTTVGFNINGNRNSQKAFDSTQAITEQVQTFNYTFITLGGAYSLLENRLVVRASYTPAFGSFTRNSFAASGSYRVSKSQSLNLNLNYFTMSSGSDFVGSLIYAIDF